jgi:hypothetical protein
MARAPDCHPTALHWGGGKCKRCYQRAWLAAKATAPKPKFKAPPQPRRTLWPQAIVTVPNMPKGWGSLT